MTLTSPITGRPTEAAQLCVAPDPIDPQVYVDAERRHAVAEALALIKAGRRGRAVYGLVRSVHAQARMSGPGVDPAEHYQPGWGRGGAR